MSFKDRIAHAFNAFVNLDQARSPLSQNYGTSYSVRPDRSRSFVSNERSIITSLYTRLAIDIASVSIKHVKLDSEGRYLEDVNSGLNNCLTIEANIDQAARQFRQDIIATLFDKGVAALVPIDTSVKPVNAGAFDILTMRVGDVVQWMPRHVRVSVYNDLTGRREEVVLEKKFVAIVENPLYSVMNEPNSTLQRLIRKLNLLDQVDEASGSGKLDLIIQLPYTVKTETMKKRAEDRRKDLEFQLAGSKYGIAYADGTEKITQLNRPVENNLLAQIKMLHEHLYGQLGLTESVINGTADEATMLNYQNRTVEPIITAIVEAMRRVFLTKTARTQGQSIEFFREPFKLVPVSQLAEIADKFTRNEVLKANEIRQIIGFKPVLDDPKADQLRNSNMPQSELGVDAPAASSASVGPDFDAMDQAMNEVFDGLTADIDALTKELAS